MSLPETMSLRFVSNHLKINENCIFWKGSFMDLNLYVFFLQLVIERHVLVSYYSCKCTPWSSEVQKGKSILKVTWAVKCKNHKSPSNLFIKKIKNIPSHVSLLLCHFGIFYRITAPEFRKLQLTLFDIKLYKLAILNIGVSTWKQISRPQPFLLLGK